MNTRHIILGIVAAIIIGLLMFFATRSKTIAPTMPGDISAPSDTRSR